MSSPVTHATAASDPDAAVHSVKTYEEQLLEAALSYAARGWPVFPCFWPVDGRCSCGNMDCKSPGKHPLTPEGFKNAMTDEEVVRAWWRKYPRASIGIPTGETSGIDVVDVDDIKIGQSALEGFINCKLKSLPRQRSGRDNGGWHFLFRHRPGVHVKNRTKFLPGMDSRGDGGYIVVAPSIHISGRHYRWLYLPDNDKFPELPEALLRAINGPTSDGKSFKPRFDTTGALKGAPVGKRRETIFKLACSLRQAAVPQDAAEELVVKATQNCEQPAGDPFTEKEALAQVEDVYKRYPAGDVGVVVINDGEAPDEVPMPERRTGKPASNKDLGVQRSADNGDEDTAFPEVA